MVDTSVAAAEAVVSGGKRDRGEASPVGASPEGAGSRGRAPSTKNRKKMRKGAPAITTTPPAVPTAVDPDDSVGGPVAGKVFSPSSSASPASHAANNDSTRKSVKRTRQSEEDSEKNRHVQATAGAKLKEGVKPANKRARRGGGGDGSRRKKTATSAGGGNEAVAATTCESDACD